MANTRIRNWCFTWNNYTDENIDWLKYKFDCRYLIFGLEIAPNTGTKHIQGYFQLEKATRMTGLKKLFGKQVHFEGAKGDDEQNKKYCSKDGEYFEKGTPSKQGKRTDLIELKDEIMTGKKTVKDIRQDNPLIYHQYGRTLEKLEEDFYASTQSMRTITNIWIYGKTGVGKTKYVYDNHKMEDIYKHKDDNGWWDLYDNQEVCLIDDFRGSIKYNEILTLADIYPETVRRRNRCPKPFTSKYLYVTSSLPPWKVYKNLTKGDSIEQLLRRFKIYKKSATDCDLLLIEPEEIRGKIEKFKNGMFI